MSDPVIAMAIVIVVADPVGAAMSVADALTIAIATVIATAMKVVMADAACQASDHVTIDQEMIGHVRIVMIAARATRPESTRPHRARWRIADPSLGRRKHITERIAPMIALSLGRRPANPVARVNVVVAVAVVVGAVVVVVAETMPPAMKYLMT